LPRSGAQPTPPVKT